MKRVYLALMVLIFFVFTITAQTRGGELESVVGKNVTVGKQWAVFIAIDKYRDNGWTNLNHPVKDAREIQQILREHYIIDNWRELFDDKASAEGIRMLFRNLRQEVGKDDSVFVFHAGHGFKDDDTDKGAWIPADASSNRDRKGGWIGHDEIRAYLDLLPAKHVFLISDSCYSGDLLANPRAGAFPRFDNDYYRKAYSLVSRQVMTSGASETVPDASDFARRLKNTLTRAEGACVDPVKLFEQVREASGTTPRLGAMPSSLHHKDGSFLFFKKQTTAANVPQQPESPTLQLSAQEHYDRGEALRKQEIWDSAIAEYSTAIRLNPRYADAYFRRGDAYDEKRDYDRAIVDYTEAIRLNPRYTDAYLYRGITYAHKKDYDRAIADYTQAIRLEPNYAMAYNYRGVAYNEKRDYDRAIADYEAALRIDPNYTLAKNNLENARKARGR